METAAAAPAGVPKARPAKIAHKPASQRAASEAKTVEQKDSVITTVKSATDVEYKGYSKQAAYELSAHVPLTAMVLPLSCLQQSAYVDRDFSACRAGPRGVRGTCVWWYHCSVHGRLISVCIPCYRIYVRCIPISSTSAIKLAYTRMSLARPRPAATRGFCALRHSRLQTGG